MKPDVSLIYVYYNTPHDLVDSVESVEKTAGRLKIQIIVVDNASPQKIPIILKKRITIIKNNNTGYGAGLNKGVTFAKSDFLILANPDTVFLVGSIQNLLKKMKDKKIGVVGPQMRDAKGRILPTISGEASLKSLLIATSFLNRLFPNTRTSRKFWLKNKDKEKEQTVPVISGACIAVRKEVFEKVKGFDERFFMYFEESDFCLKVRKAGYKTVYFPDSKIIHKVSASSNDKGKIEERFSESRYKFLKKNNPFWKATFAELFFRMTTTSGFLLLIAICASLFFNLYQINTNMLFIGDFGRDYLAARDMLLTGKIPLLGIRSSVVWLHQGPLSIYFIAISFLVGKFNPIAPAIFYSLLGVVAVYLVYVVGKQLFNSKVGAFASIFYATSPLIIMSSRMPYHTSSIPFFTLIFFLLTIKIIHGNKKLLPLAGFILGLLMLLELSNAALFLIIFILYIWLRPKLQRKDVAKTIGAFLLGISPFLLYDLTHHFIQTLGLPLWIVNRVRLFLGLGTPDKVTTGHLPGALATVYQQLTGIVFPESIFVFFMIMLVVVIYFFFNVSAIREVKRINSLHILILWFCLPVCAYLIHAAPGTAYFPLLFPVVALILGASFLFLYEKKKLTILILIIICFMNGIFLVRNNYYLTTKGHPRSLPPFHYGYGTTLYYQEEAVKAMVLDARGRPFRITGSGFFITIPTGLDNYSYLAWYYGGKIDKKSELVYVIYEDQHAVKEPSTIIFNNSIIAIGKK